MEQAGGNLAPKGNMISAAPAPWQVLQVTLTTLTLLSFCFKLIFIYFMWLCHVSAAASGTFRCGMWDLLSWPRMEPGTSALGAQSATGRPGKCLGLHASPKACTSWTNISPTPSSPSPCEPLCYSLLLWDWVFQIPYANGTMQYMPFFVWLISIGC